MQGNALLTMALPGRRFALGGHNGAHATRCLTEKGRTAMSFERAKAYLEELGLGDRVMEFDESSATVAQAAHAAGTSEAEIVKTLSFLVGDRAVLVCAAGDTKIDNPKFKAEFHAKAKMIPGDRVEELVGHAPGGVCPFAVAAQTPVYLDESIRRFAYVYPACGNSNSAVKLTPQELERASSCAKWVDVCKPMG